MKYTFNILKKINDHFIHLFKILELRTWFVQFVNLEFKIPGTREVFGKG